MNNNVIDIHVHFGAPRNDQNECYWSKKFESTPAYWFMKITSGALLKKTSFNLFFNKILKVINDSKKVNKVVLLAMDKVYDENGKAKDHETHLFVPNSFIVNLTQQNKRILLGASIHPYRDDCETEFKYCLEKGAKLIKWIPSSQQIDPEHQKCFPFYSKLIEHELPLLVHCGPEYAIPTSNSNFIEKNNPKYLRKALEMGVTIIIAHCALPYWGKLDKDYFDDKEEFFKLFEDARKNNWNLYADLSALATPLRSDFIPEIKEKIPQERLLFGSDYPIPASELSYKKTKNPIKWVQLFFKALQIKNPLDKNYQLISKMGLDNKIFANATKLFLEIEYA